jgi:hypothetical protein
MSASPASSYKSGSVTIAAFDAISAGYDGAINLSGEAPYAGTFDSTYSVCDYISAREVLEGDSAWQDFSQRWNSRARNYCPDCARGGLQQILREDGLYTWELSLIAGLPIIAFTFVLALVLATLARK